MFNTFEHLLNNFYYKFYKKFVSKVILKNEKWKSLLENEGLMCDLIQMW